MQFKCEFTVLFYITSKILNWAIPTASTVLAEKPITKVQNVLYFNYSCMLHLFHKSVKNKKPMTQ